MNFKITLLTIFAFISFQNFAQERCGMTNKINELCNHDSVKIQEYYNDYEQIRDFLVPSKRDGNSTTTVVTIPVVVHVIYKNTTQNISDAQINSQIEVLNADFRKLNTDFSTVVPSYFQPFGADFEIEFVLAKRTPSNVATTGIVRKSVNSSFNFGDNYYKATGSPAWDTNKYLNIWVGQFTGEGDAANILGWAYLPTPGMVGSNRDGLAIGYQYFGTMGTASYPYNKGRTATHEIGHYLGLNHIWGNDGSVCGTLANNDGVSDTPATDYPYFGCPSYSQRNVNTCVNTTNGAMFMNYMDYVNDSCMAFFTLGQKTIVQNVLNGIRSELLTSLGGVALGQEEFAMTNAIRVYPNPVNNIIHIDSPLTEIDQVEIFNNIGQLISTQKLPVSNTSINVDNFIQGIYFLKLYTADGKLIKTEKIIKN